MSQPPKRSHLRLVSSQPEKPKRPQRDFALYRRVLLLFGGLSAATLAVRALLDQARPDEQDLIVSLLFGSLIAGIELFRGRKAMS